MPWTQVRLTAFGGPEGLELVTRTDPPTPGPGEVRVRVRVTSAAFTDVMIRKGMYPDVTEKPPFVLGYDMVGVVDALGPEASRFALGDRVADLTTIGAYSEYLCLPEDRLTPVPEGLTDVDALGIILSGVTPYQMLHRVAKLTAGQSLLIHGAGGAVGTAMLQLARDAGIAAFGSDVAAKHDVIRSLGATPLDADAPEGVIRAATGDGVDAVFDPLGGDSLSRSLHVLKPGGMLVAFGFQNEVLGRGGTIPLDFVKLKIWDWLPNGHATAFYSIGAMRRAHPEWFRADLGALFGLLAEGRIAPVVAEVLPLSAVREAHRRIEAGTVTGKLVLRVSEA
ncbi:medium chain dehydrogenase/reductase family protein [Jannaschia seohaensis]|uniref:NADPH:quinone reductase n=1 Tax=Jannaschia seohaensis TaxID=475081 RepID=A0A2Y9AM02_9RHOB|nr:medium chain dehydrogenase/reductase family protein [Jannaschia seohaensis]PWJ20313.1 NADPH:quinone reductase-like Zn-dependent oxidoreductase [Jannaschia seohaensis]SSA44348.1 NADPH:quinone reductase [Jannaschia seohaensis]